MHAERLDDHPEDPLVHGAAGWQTCAVERPETDYLVVGAGASGLSFTDALVAESDADVLMVDRRERVGGHWNHAYEFLRLHIPSANYGVNSLPLGADTLDDEGRQRPCLLR